MRHLKAGRRLGVTTSHRRAMMRNLVTSLIEKEQITCTVTRAKELRKPLDKMITLGKKGDLHARRQALKFIKSKEAMAALFGELAERYQDRSGGYSRIIKLSTRRLGDGAEMAIIQLVGSSEDVLSDLKKKSSIKKEDKPKSTVLDDVSDEIKEEGLSAVDSSKEEKVESSEDSTVVAEGRPEEVVDTEEKSEKPAEKEEKSEESSSEENSKKE